MWFINVIWSIPTLLLVFAITLALGKGFWQVFIAVGLTMWVNVARLVRGQVLAEREKEYIEATRALGFFRPAYHRPAYLAQYHGTGNGDRRIQFRVGHCNLKPD